MQLKYRSRSASRSASIPPRSCTQGLTSRACSWQIQSRTWVRVQALGLWARHDSCAPSLQASHLLSMQTPAARPAAERSQPSVVNGCGVLLAETICFYQGICIQKPYVYCHPVIKAGFCDEVAALEGTTEYNSREYRQGQSTCRAGMSSSRWMAGMAKNDHVMAAAVSTTCRISQLQMPGDLT